MTEKEFQTIIDKIDNLERKVDQDNQLLSQKIELYRQVGEAQINSIRLEVEAFQDANKQQIETNRQQIEANRQQIEAFQDANKQQLNVSLGVLVTAAAAILASVVLGIAN